MVPIDRIGHVGRRSSAALPPRSESRSMTGANSHSHQPYSRMRVFIPREHKPKGESTGAFPRAPRASALNLALICVVGCSMALFFAKGSHHC
ncbi:hypothetical protein M440DRAFT_1027497 [Trichoderma longibrachiatum ATCC 18648]|uniref:Uncharacterized protein n=1 Tax=Trichoderma longibrachiatum ATCC 18648 TaxID=983965 RepID=A0A2T4CK72_TRILO|nr:hypothetical protein M440DRAFT_1027497 [Trichoderma longibrachiatum ATCC 18648]